MFKRFTAWILSIFVLSSCFYIVTSANEMGTNIALGKKVTGTSQYSDSYSLAKLVDGKYDTSWSIGSIKLGDKWNNMDYAAVDLGAKYNVSRIVAYSRQDIDQPSSRKGWIVYGANAADFSDAVKLGSKPNEGEIGSTLEIVFDVPEAYRHIIIARTGSIVVAELEVYGDIAPVIVDGDFEDVSGELNDQIRFVYGLGIMDGISPGEFGVNKLMKRCEATEAVVKMMRLDWEKNDSGFEDVPADSKYAPFITAAKDLGLISAADKFRPDDFVTVPEFLKMVISAMNYDIILKNGIYPTNVISLAQNLGLLTGTECKYSDEHISRQSAAGIIYNALLAPEMGVDYVTNDNMILSHGYCMLTSVYKYNLFRGIVTANNVTDLISPQSYDADRIYINSKPFRDEEGILSGFIGKSVLAVVNADNEVICGWEDLNNTRVLTVYGDMIAPGSSIRGLKYYLQTGKLTDASFVDGIPVLKNGVAFSGVNFSNPVSKYGKIEIIDNNDDGKYDVMHIFEPQILVAGTVYKTENELSISALTGSNFYADRFDVCDTFKDGRPFETENIAAGYLICAYVSENGKYVRIDCSNNKMYGKLTATSNDKIYIDGEEYETTKYFQDNKSEINGFGIGFVGTFFLDERGYVVSADSEGLQKGGKSLAVIRGIAEGDVFSGARVSVYEEGSFKIYDTKPYVKVDGAKKTAAELKSMENTICKGMVYLTVDLEGVLTSISTDGLVSEDMRISDGVYKTADAIYSDRDMVLYIDRDIPAYVIPTDKQDMPRTEDRFNEYYQKTTLNNLFKANTRISGTKLSFYNLDSSRKADFAVLYQKLSDEQDKTNAISTNAPTMVVESVGRSLSADGEEGYCIYGYDIQTGRAVEYNLRPVLENVVDTYKLQKDKITDSSYDNTYFNTYKYVRMSADLTGYVSGIDTLGCGDIVRYELRDGVIRGLDRIYSNADSSIAYKQIYTAGNNNTIIISQFRLYKTKFESVKNNLVKLDMQNEEGSQAGGTAKIFVDLSSMEGELLVVDEGKIKRESYMNFANICTAANDVVLMSALGVNKAMVVYK